jgi:malonate-semialdehyde dehydrogenase (acetylating)/methylmalonate-semialdehyde dehydrogenase
MNSRPGSPPSAGPVRPAAKAPAEHACSIGTLTLGEIAENVAGGVDTYYIRQPLGVCAGITPFNFPAMIPLWMFPMAIVCGNTFVLKPSEQDPMTPMLLAELALEAGVPPGVLNVVHGGKEAVDALCSHPEVKAVSFVGSTGGRSTASTSCRRWSRPSACPAAS